MALVEDLANKNKYIRGLMTVIVDLQVNILKVKQTNLADEVLTLKATNLIRGLEVKSVEEREHQFERL